MQQFSSTLSTLFLPVGSDDLSLYNTLIPFLPNSPSLPNTTCICSKITAGSTRKNFVHPPFFRQKILGLLGWLVPGSLVISTALFTSFTQWHFTSQANTDKPTVSLESIKAHKTLTIATTQNESTYFGTADFEHGFGYDVMNNYANTLGVKLKTLVFVNEAQAKTAIEQGQADMLLTSLPRALPDAANEESLATLSVSCQNDFLTRHGLSRDTSVVLPNVDKKLLSNLQDYLCDTHVLNTNQQLAAFYTAHVFDNEYSQNKFADTMATQLPNYRKTFQQSAKKHDLDWQLLVAMGYQESQLQPDAVSPTGVRGIMMLTSDTAEQMGVEDRIDPLQSIQGGAKLVKLLDKQFEDIPQTDRLWFTLAAYNMGPQAIRNIQQQLIAQGRDANSWAEVYAYLANHATKNSRYVQCMQYVTHIRGYLEVLKLKNVTQQQVA